jgi:hypothetical protein
VPYGLPSRYDSGVTGIIPLKMEKKILQKRIDHAKAITAKRISKGYMPIIFLIAGIAAYYLSTGWLRETGPFIVGWALLWLGEIDSYKKATGLSP